MLVYFSSSEVLEGLDPSGSSEPAWLRDSSTFFFDTALPSSSMLEREYLLTMSKKEQYSGVCTSCAKLIHSGQVKFRLGPEGNLKCFKCASTDGAILKRSTLISVIVGTLLTFINQGDEIFGGTAGDDLSLAWKIPLTFITPFMVSWVSVMSASKVPTNSALTDGGIDNTSEISRGGAGGYQA